MWCSCNSLCVLLLLSASMRWKTRQKNVDKLRQVECSAVAVRPSSLFLPLGVCLGAPVSHLPRLSNCTHSPELTQTCAQTHTRTKSATWTNFALVNQQTRILWISCKQDLISTSRSDGSQVMLKLNGEAVAMVSFQPPGGKCKREKKSEWRPHAFDSRDSSDSCCSVQRVKLKQATLAQL